MLKHRKVSHRPVSQRGEEVIFIYSSSQASLIQSTNSCNFLHEEPRTSCKHGRVNPHGNASLIHGPRYEPINQVEVYQGRPVISQYELTIIKLSGFSPRTSLRMTDTRWMIPLIIRARAASRYTPEINLTGINTYLVSTTTKPVEIFHHRDDELPSRSTVIITFRISSHSPQPRQA